MAPTTRSRSASAQQDKENVWPSRKEADKPITQALRKAYLKAKPTGKKAKKSPSTPLANDLLGQYRIEAPYIEEQWGEGETAMVLNLAPSPGAGQHMWGGFHFQVASGVMRGGPPPQKVGDSWDFEWRGNDEGEGDVICEFNDEGAPRGTITFLSGGKLKGTMEGGFLEEFEFTGRKLKTPVGAKAVKGWKERWRTTNMWAMDVEQEWKEGCAINGMPKYGPPFELCNEGPAQSDSSSDEA